LLEHSIETYGIELPQIIVGDQSLNTEVGAWLPLYALLQFSIAVISSDRMTALRFHRRARLFRLAVLVNVGRDAGPAQRHGLHFFQQFYGSNQACSVF
jgi:hypothetical protein